MLPVVPLATYTRDAIRIAARDAVLGTFGAPCAPVSGLASVPAPPSQPFASIATPISSLSTSCVTPVTTVRHTEPAPHGTERATLDGNGAVARVAYHLSENIAIFPITPSSPAAQECDAWASAGVPNAFGLPTTVIQLESEMGVAGALHGSARSGVLSTTFTSSQGLLLMPPNMFRFAGELLPVVMHVPAREVGSVMASIHGDHSDVMSVRPTGVAMLASAAVQEAADLALVSHLAALDTSLPFLHFYDGFRTSHEINTVETVTKDAISSLIDEEKLDAFRARANTAANPQMVGSVSDPTMHMAGTEVVNRYFWDAPAAVQGIMDKVAGITGRQYHLFDYVGHPLAEHVVVQMASGCTATEEAVKALVAEGRRVGLVKVRLFRPFSVAALRRVIPPSTRRIAVLDRTKEFGGREPLYEDVVAALRSGALPEHERAEVNDESPGLPNLEMIVGGRFGLGGTEYTPSHAATVFDNLSSPQPRDGFTVGIVDDITNTSLTPPPRKISHMPEGTVQAQVWGLGSDGSVGSCKTAMKLIGGQDRYVQAFFAYDARKSGGVTVSHLRFGQEPIDSAYLVDNADLISCNQPTYAERFGAEMARALAPGGTLVINCPWADAQELQQHLPPAMLRAIAKQGTSLYVIDAEKICNEFGLPGRIGAVMGPVFQQLSGALEPTRAIELLRTDVAKKFASKGEEVVAKNLAIIDNSLSQLHQVPVPQSWASAADRPASPPAADRPEWVTEFSDRVNARTAGELTVADHLRIHDPMFGQHVHCSQYDKRGLATHVPVWDAKKCIQCNICGAVCPHAAVRPFLLSESELAEVPGEPLVAAKAKGKALKDLKFHIDVSTYDCTGCNKCVVSCPADALAMAPNTEERKAAEGPVWDYLVAKVADKTAERLGAGDALKTLRAAQFVTPQLEFSGACAGCSETAPIKMLTQLFGPRLNFTVASGCAAIWSASVGNSPYTRRGSDGRGPCYANSLFEDPAQYAMGVHSASTTARLQMQANAKRFLEENASGPLADAVRGWLDVFDDDDRTVDASNALLDALTTPAGASAMRTSPALRALYSHRHHLVKPLTVVFGGDGWAYDIGYGGLDHILASGEKVMAVVVDTEVYSNTGGQRSKATPRSAVAKFAAGGKAAPRKDLGAVFRTYGDIFVANCAFDADPQQALTALREAAAYDGPSLVIFSTPCIEWQMEGGQGTGSVEISKLAVDAGINPLYRYHPQRGLTLDSTTKLDDVKFAQWIERQNRFMALERIREGPEVEAVHAQLRADIARTNARLEMEASK